MRFIDTTKSVLNNKKIIPMLLLLMLLGVIIMILSNVIVPDNSRKEYNTTNNDEEQIVADETSLEKNLENILSQIKDVGDVEVLIVYESGNEDVILKDTEKDGTEKTVFQTESSISKPYVTKTLYPEVSGVIIAAQGADKVEVKAALSDTVSAVLDIPIHKVKILKKN